MDSSKILSLSSEGLTELMREILAQNRCFRFSARGLSMHPAIRDRDIVTVAPIKSVTLRRGNVVACLVGENGRLLVHRICRIKQDNFLIRGDRLYSADGWVKRENIIGLVKKVERKQRRIWWPYATSLPAAAWGAHYFYQLAFRLKKRVKKVLKKYAA